MDLEGAVLNQQYKSVLADTHACTHRTHAYPDLSCVMGRAEGLLMGHILGTVALRLLDLGSSVPCMCGCTVFVKDLAVHKLLKG